MKHYILAFGLIFSLSLVSFIKPDQTQKLRLDLTVDQINIILSGLSTMPYKDAAGVISEIQRQATVQLQPQVPAKVDSSKNKNKKP